MKQGMYKLSIPNKAFLLIALIVLCTIILMTHALAQGEQGVTLTIDEDGDDITDKVVFSDAELTDTNILFPAITFLPPLSKKTVFTAGETIPVKSRLFDEQNVSIRNASASLWFAPITKNTVGKFMPAKSRDKKTRNNKFTFLGGGDDDKGFYFFNWDTNKLAAPKYRLRVDVDNNT